VQIPPVSRVAESGASAVVLNVTVTNPTSASYLTVYPSGTTRPTVSNLNFTAGWTGGNSVTVPVGENGKIDIYNAGGTVDVIADILGVYQKRDGIILASGVRAVAVNITAVSPTSSGFLTTWAGHRPLASTLNFTPNSVVPNFTVVPTMYCERTPSCAGIPEISVYNGSSGATHIVIDVLGFFDDAHVSHRQPVTSGGPCPGAM
jgi:hypothetical protein